MKTFRLITVMVLVVGLIGVISALGAEQTKTGNKGTPVTEKKESKDQKKVPAPGSTTMQAPAAAVQSLPLTITRLYVKDGTVHVVIKKQGSQRLSDKDYAATKLKVEARTLKKPLEWTLLKVDPHKRFTRRNRREQDFDTGLAVTERVKVTATLYRGLWKTAKEETLSPTMATVAVKTRMGTPEKEDTSRDRVLLEHETSPAKVAPVEMLARAPEERPGSPRKGVAKGRGNSHGIVVEQPRWGEIHVLEERLQVLWRLEDESAGRWRTVRISLQGVDFSFERELDSRMAQSGRAVEVELPEDCEEGFDRSYSIKVQDARDDDVQGYSGSFTLLSSTGPMGGWANARDNDATPTSIRVFKPSGTQPPWRLRADDERNPRLIEWWVVPVLMPVHEHFELQCVTEGGAEVGEAVEVSSGDFFFNQESRVYRTRVDIGEFGLDPGRYRLEVRLIPTADDDFPAVSGRSDVITLEPAIPAQTLERAFGEGCVEVMAPEGNTSIHAGTDLRVRWEFCPELEELIESARGALGLPLLEQYVSLVWVRRDGSLPIVLRQKVPGHASSDARSYDLPLPRDRVDEGTYYVIVEAVMYLYGTEGETARGRSDTFTILNP